jgi:transposase
LTKSIADFSRLRYFFAMYIRRTHTNNSSTGERYYTYRLVASQRVDGKPRQMTLLNLGRHFAVDQDLWASLCVRIEQLLSHQAELLPIELPAAVEKAAQRIAAQLIEQRGVVVKTPIADEGHSSPAESSVAPGESVQAAPADLQAVDVDSLELSRPRTVGVEQLGLWAMQQLNFLDLLAHLGINGAHIAAIVGSIIGRMAGVVSELATHNWLMKQSALGELLAVDYASLPLMTMYRAADALWKHRPRIEQTLFTRLTDLFGFSTTITLYDLTNTYFEGEVPNNTKARHGHSKEQRTDCPLVTLGLVLDGSGFVRRSQTFAGNVSEASTLETMLQDLNAPQGALVVMDAGIATEANIQWLRKTGYGYLVVSREHSRQFNADDAVPLETAAQETVRCQKVVTEDGQEVRLYCHSPGREQKEQAMAERFASRFETELNAINEGLQRPRTEKRPDKLWERIGRLKEKQHGIGQHYQIDLQTDDSGEKALSITWQKHRVPGSYVDLPGVYCLRSNQCQWTEEPLWRTYMMLTDLEAVFRCFKSDLGFRPIFHSKEERADSHLFITVLAYQFVQLIRRCLKESGINSNSSWRTLREIMSTQCRVTASFRRADGKALHVRKATRAEPEQMAIYRALKVNPAPGGISKTIV